MGRITMKNKKNNNMNQEKLEDIYDFSLDDWEKKKQEIIKEEREKYKNTPMGVSQWIEHGKKYGYAKFFLEEYKKNNDSIINIK